MSETVLTNARIVLADEIVAGTLVQRDGRIADVSPGPVRRGEDMAGDLLLPGLVELHTDHLESHYAPRPGVRWNAVAAVQAHDAQIAASGITTVFDALRIGMDEENGIAVAEMRGLADAIAATQGAGSLRAEHFIHLRCEVSAPDMLDGFAVFRHDPRLRLASLMDHTPGQRQFTTMESYRRYYQGKTGMSDAAFDAFVARRQAQAGAHAAANRRAVAAAARESGIVLASHDDATAAHVEEARQQDVRVAEFPTTVEAARASREAGMQVLMGAPNVVRGGSHSGNVAAVELAEAGLLDVLSSDYVPSSLLHAAFRLAEVVPALDLPRTVAMVSANPARAAGLDDRGRIAPGLRADLVRVGTGVEVPVVRSVWREGRRVA